MEATSTGDIAYQQKQRGRDRRNKDDVNRYIGLHIVIRGMVLIALMPRNVRDCCDMPCTRHHVRNGSVPNRGVFLQKPAAIPDVRSPC